ncbi:hypothetical protein OIU84_019543 [Salix udensis]|uniref:Uncharacterized protein n=1 Tax=Salix udensis TaxID=889485 RepID=A0AAD6L1G0_9ROSI|nr:hypothetical protein OIU84_019543 [Salix udensis]
MRRDHCHTMTSCDFNHWTYILHHSTDDDTLQCQPLNTHTGPLLSKVHGLQMSTSSDLTLLSLKPNFSPEADKACWLIGEQKFPSLEIPRHTQCAEGPSASR